MSTVSTQDEVSPTKHTLQVVVVAAAVCVDLIAVIVAITGVAPALGFLPLFTLPATLFLLGWGLTWLARRQAGRLLAGGAAPPPLLAGRRLWAIRVGCLVLFAATALVYAFALAVVWREANGLYVPEPDHEIVAPGSFGLTWGELYTLSAVAKTPGWYPWLVVVREALVVMAALAIAWSVFARRPRHWMAYFVAGLIALSPLGDLSGLDFSLSPVDDLARVLGFVLLLGAGGFLWMFPDGRFRRTYLRYLALVLAALAVGYLLVRRFGGNVQDVTWGVAFLAVILVVTGGVATQVWRYRHVPLSSKRLARWNLAILVAIPAWGLFYPWVYGRYERGAGMAAFVWHQVHLTIYLAGPVLLGLWVLYLMRNQGWWDARRFWQRTTVLAILAPLFIAAYVGVVVAVTVVTQAISGDKSQTVAVLIATAAVAFAFRPVQRVVAGWVDRRFFPSRRIAEETVARFTDRVRQEADPVIVRDELLAVVHETLDPEHAAVWVARREVQ